MLPLEQFEAALARALKGPGFRLAEGDSEGPGFRLAEGDSEGPGFRLAEAIRWAVEGGGKRIRPRICLAAAVAAGGRAEDALVPACAIELLHSYTLVHDDLPAMDNDTMRRGKASVWAKFGEADAILAGDALQALAFRTAARSPRNAARIVSSLSSAAYDVVRGQAADLGEWGMGNGERGMGNGERTEAERRIEFIFSNKTAALFVAAAEMGALAAGADEGTVASLRSYARDLGFAFQYEDDLLDSDDGAFSSVAILGADEVRRRVRLHTESALAALAGLPGDAAPLAELASGLVSRRR